MPIPLALCFRAQAQSLQARDHVRPKYTPRYSMTKLAEPGISAAIRPFSDVCSRRTYQPDDLWMPMPRWKAEGHRFC